MSRITSRSVTGFTFLEIMLVVAIIGILAAIVATNIARNAPKAKIAATVAQITTLETALQQYALEADVYPTTDEGLQALVQRPASFPEGADWPEFGFLGKNFVPKDAWHQPFHYAAPSEHGMPFEISSAGHDRQHGTGDDVTNWHQGNGVLKR